MQDLARLGVPLGDGGVGLGGGQVGEHPAGDVRVQPERLQRGDDPVAAEGRRKPRYARVRVGPCGKRCCQQRQVGARFVDPFIEPSRRAAGARPTATAKPHVRSRTCGGGAKPRFIGHPLPVRPDLDIEDAPGVMGQDQAPLGTVRRERRGLLRK